jgi:hypothetical protein
MNRLVIGNKRNIEKFLEKRAHRRIRPERTEWIEIKVKPIIGWHGMGSLARSASHVG